MTAFKGLGTYGNAVGVVTPLDHKLADAGLLVKTTTALGVRPGVFYAGNASLISGTAGMAYSVAAYACATQRSASAGAVLGGNDGALSVATTAAPGSNSRIDIIYHWHREYSLDGADSNPVIGVIQGTAAAVPTAPSLAAFPGAIEIGRATVSAGATATNGGGVVLTQTSPFTTVDGGKVTFRSTTEMNLWTSALTGQTALDISSGITYRYTGSAWTIASFDDTGWITATPLGTNWVLNSVAPQYRRINGIVYIKGRANSSAATTATAFTLPVGFRPQDSRVFGLDANGTTIRSQVTAAGVVGPVVAATIVALSFDGIAPFPTDA